MFYTIWKETEAEAQEVCTSFNSSINDHTDKVTADDFGSVCSKSNEITSFCWILKVCLPASVLEHIDATECVFKLSSSVKTSRGVGKIAMTQRRLFLLTDGRPGYVEVAQYRDLEVN